MFKVIIWGTGFGYDLRINQFQYEELKGNIEIVAVVSSEKSLTSIDGRKVIRKEEIKEYQYDYLIMATNKNLEELRKEAISFSVDSSKIIKGDVFLRPFFDFKRYIKILKSKITIIADNCWGAYTYNYLGLQFNSPFILCFVSSTDNSNETIASEEYLKMLSNLDYYIQSPLQEVRDMPMNGYWCWPKGKLGTGTDSVYLNFNHSNSFKEAEADWNRRVKRYNSENLFVKMTIYNDEQAEKFSQLPFKNKVGFYHKDTPYKSIVNLCDWQNRQVREERKSFDAFILRCSDTSKFNSKPYDVFKLLLGESDFLRKY